MPGIKWSLERASRLSHASVGATAESYRVLRSYQKSPNVKLADILACRNRLPPSESWVFACYEIRDREPVLTLVRHFMSANKVGFARNLHVVTQKKKIHAVAVQTRAEEPAGTRFLGLWIRHEQVSVVFCGAGPFGVRKF